MICTECAHAADNQLPHNLTRCPGGTWCDCQHMPHAPYRHRNGQQCWGCQSCFADAIDDDDTTEVTA